MNKFIEIFSINVPGRGSLANRWEIIRNVVNLILPSYSFTKRTGFIKKSQEYHSIKWLVICMPFVLSYVRKSKR